MAPILMEDSKVKKVKGLNGKKVNKKLCKSGRYWSLGNSIQKWQCLLP
jgi:hypothetical protein